MLGPTTKVGYRSLTHFERRDLSHVIRKSDIVTVDGKERYHWRDNRTMEIERTFHLLALDEGAAERVEKRILSGERVHFGLDADVLGMICRSNHVISAINAPEETIRRLCVEPGLELRLISTPRNRPRLRHLLASAKAEQSNRLPLSAWATRPWPLDFLPQAVLRDSNQ